MLDALVIDGDAQVLAAARPPCDEPQQTVAGRDVDRARRRAVREPHDDRVLAAVQEEMLNRVRNETERRVSPEYPAVLVEARNGHGPIDGAALRSADEGDDGH